MAVNFVRPKNPKLAKDPWQIQLDDDGKLRHLLSIQGLKPNHIIEILDRAESFLDADNNLIKQPLLKNSVVFNIFFEPSTRTLKTFEVAQKQLSADIHNLNVSTSSTSKGETLLDTLANLKAMYADMLVVRHSESGAPLFFAQHVGEGLSVVNAGDGRHEHPTQALLDMFTIRKHKGDFTKLKVAIVGDVLHSRVARSQIHALNLLSVDELRVVAPSTLTPTEAQKMGVQVFHDIEAGIKNCDVVIMVRLQKERMERGLLPSESEYYKRYGLSPARLTLPKADAIIMHPGPANRGVEIASEVMDGSQSVILDQVSNGIAVRMAVLSILKENRQEGLA